MSRGANNDKSDAADVRSTIVFLSASEKGTRDSKLGVSFWSSKADISSYQEARDQGLLHRADGPAVEWDDGSLEFWSQGKLHRDPAEGPAVILTSELAQSETGEEEIDALAELLDEYINFSALSLYVVDGKLHREDGPAYVDDDGFIEGYYLNGQLHRDGGLPALVWQYEDGEMSSRFAVNGKLHREDGPALVQTKGDGGDWTLAWFTNGKLDREDGPAVIVGAGMTCSAAEVAEATGMKSIPGFTALYYRDGELIPDGDTGGTVR